MVKVCQVNNAYCKIGYLLRDRWSNEFGPILLLDFSKYK